MKFSEFKVDTWYRFVPSNYSDQDWIAKFNGFGENKAYSIHHMRLKQNWGRMGSGGTFSYSDVENARECNQYEIIYAEECLKRGECIPFDTFITPEPIINESYEMY